MNSLIDSVSHAPRQAGTFPETNQVAKPFKVGRFSPGRPVLKKILLVDDDPGVREMLGRVLQAENYEVIPAQNGNEAATKFLARQPDLVLLDLNLPERDGWSAFRFMEAAQPMLPVIIITARSDQYAHADKMGVDALMEKPLNLPVLLAAIGELLAESEAERTRRLTNPEFKTAHLPPDHSSAVSAVAP